MTIPQNSVACALRWVALRPMQLVLLIWEVMQVQIRLPCTKDEPSRAMPSKLSIVLEVKCDNTVTSP